MNYKKTNIVFVIIFMSLLVITLLKTNTEVDAVSEIDNKTLAASPLSSIGTSTLSMAVDNYFSDRIGFRYEYIKWYEKAHDVVFNMLIHPFYMYGKDKEIFATFDKLYFDDKEYLTDFSDFVLDMQNYCKKKDVKFVFQYEPDKSSIKTELLPDGLYHDSAWTDFLFKEFDKRNINYVDNITLLNQLDDEGVFVYNHKADAGHFNDNGSYYSVNNVLENLNKTNSLIHVNKASEIEFGTTIVTKLLQSEFIINEEVPLNKIKNSNFKEIKMFIDDIYFDPEYSGHTYFENPERQKERAPRALVFGGSHMSMNNKYYANSFSEYYYVTNYINVVNYEYYIDKFKPDVVVFEISQRTIGKDYFPISKKEELKANIEAYENTRYGTK